MAAGGQPRQDRAATSVFCREVEVCAACDGFVCRIDRRQPRFRRDAGASGHNCDVGDVGEPIRGWSERRIEQRGERLKQWLEWQREHLKPRIKGRR